MITIVIIAVLLFVSALVYLVFLVRRITKNEIRLERRNKELQRVSDELISEVKMWVPVSTALKSTMNELNLSSHHFFVSEETAAMLLILKEIGSDLHKQLIQVSEGCMMQEEKVAYMKDLYEILHRGEKFHFKKQFGVGKQVK